MAAATPDGVLTKLTNLRVNSKGIPTWMLTITGANGDTHTLVTRSGDPVGTTLSHAWEGREVAATIDAYGCVVGIKEK